MIRALYDWTMRLAAHRHATRALALVSFAESSFFPIPPDVMILPMVLADRARAWRIALVCTVASVLGALAGYAIGYFLWEVIGQPIFEAYGYADKFDLFREKYNEWGAWIVLVGAITFIPYKVTTIASGLTGLGLPVFIIASIAGRGFRFFAVAGLLYVFGPQIKSFIERWLGLLFVLFVVLLFAGFAVIKLL